MKKNQAAFLILVLFVLGVLQSGRAQAVESNGFSQIIWDYLETLCGFGPRNPGSVGHARTVDLIKETGRTYADRVFEYTFSLKSSAGEKVEMSNLELQFSGTRGGQPILIGVHYDTRPFADEEEDVSLHSRPIIGANDGGSGTAILLGLARYLHEHQPGRPVNLVFFDGEDYGVKNSGENLIGSTYYAAQLEKVERKEWPYAVLILDMVGDKDLNIFKETHSMESGLWLLDALYGAAEKLKLSQFRTNSKYSIYDDHYPFLQMGIPSVVLIDFDYPHWHKLSDTLDKCSPESLMAVFNTVTETLGEL